MAVQWTDPCAKYAALHEAYMQLISGEREALIRTKTGETEEEVRYQAANLNALRLEMSIAERQCAAANGTVSVRQRFAITAGSRLP